MSRALVSLARAKDHLRVDHDADDAHIEFLSEAAGDAVLRYLKSAAQAWTDSAGDVLTDSAGDPLHVPFAAQAAALLLLAELYKNREAAQDGEVNAQFGYGYLPRPVIALLYPLRDPALQ